MFKSVSCCLLALFEIMKLGKNTFKWTASCFSPAITGSFPKADRVRSVADTVALVTAMLQLFHFFPARNHFPNGPILTYNPSYVKIGPLEASVPQIYNLSLYRQLLSVLQNSLRLLKCF